MKLTLIHTGKTKSAYIKTGCVDYHDRIKKYISFRDIYTAEKKSIHSTDIMTRFEGQQLLKIISPSDYLVLFDEKGESYNSISFASYLEKLFMAGKPLVFATGGAYGFSDNVYERADSKISLSGMTFSHQLVRLIIAEQLYRALTILKGEKYHH